MIRHLSLLAFLCAMLPTIAGAALVPDPSLSAKRVVEIQVVALQRNDSPSADAGIIQTWSFAHPKNKNATGPLEHFKLMIKGPNYSPLLNHNDHKIEPLAQEQDSAAFAVTIFPADGPVLVYQWILERVQEGPSAGAWMTTIVSPPAAIGRAA